MGRGEKRKVVTGKREALQMTGRLGYRSPIKTASNKDQEPATETQNSRSEGQNKPPNRHENDSVPNKMLLDLQSFPEAIYEGLEEGFIVGNGLEYVSICCHVADGPLAKPCTTQSEDVTEERYMKSKTC